MPLVACGGSLDMSSDRPELALFAAHAQQSKGDALLSAPTKLSKVKPVAMQDLKRCKLTTAELVETSSVQHAPQAHGLFACEPVARAFGQEGASKHPYANHDASRPFEFQKRALSSSSDSQPCADVSPASAGHSLPLPSPGTPSPACLMPSSHHVLTVDIASQVCTQLGSDSLHASTDSGIAPVHSGSLNDSVQLTTPSAVGGPSPVSRQCTFLCRKHLITVAPNSSSVPPAIAMHTSSATPFAPGPYSSQCLTAATCRPPGSTPDTSLSSSSRHLAAATARLPGSPSACASPLPQLSLSSSRSSPPPPATASASHCTLANSSMVSLKRKPIFPLGPRLPKRFRPV